MIKNKLREYAWLWITVFLAVFVVLATIAIIEIYVVPLPEGWKWIGPRT